MNRDYKEFGTGEWYQIFNRGNGKMDEKSQPRNSFFKPLETFESQGAPLRISRTRNPIRVTPFESDAFSIAAYCLMPNHFHFLIQQNTDVPISKLFLRLLTSYSMYFNRKYDHVGHVFQDRIRSVHIEDNTQLLHVSAYIHQNPRVANIVGNLERWPHSSYPEYTGEKEEGICDTDIVLGQFTNAREYRRFVEDAFEDIRARKEIARELMMDV